MSITAIRTFRSSVSVTRSHLGVGKNRSIHTNNTPRKIHTSRVGDDNEARMNHVLSAYPTFNLNPNESSFIDKPLGPRKGDEAILTLSGGVDSSMAAYLALTKGGLIPHRTIFMRNWNSLDESETFEPGAGGAEGCQWLRDWHRVEAMASWLDVKPELVDLSIPYWNSVFAPALDDWQIGRTPNPDIACNREIKFGELLQQIDSEEQNSNPFGRYKPRRWLVTGHYAHVDYYYPQQDSTLHGRLLRAKDSNKDQSYFLSGVSSIHLGRSHFPLANVEKDDVRAAARALGMPTAESEESMGLCFVGKRNKRQEEQSQKSITKGKGTGPMATQLGFAGFLGDYIDRKPGPILTLEGKEIGTHSGLHTLTIGQRARVGGAQQKFFVAAKDVKSNGVIVVPGADHPMLQCTWLDIDDFYVVSSATFNSTGTLHAQIRHRQDSVACHIEKRGSSIRVHFDQPISSVAQGQVCALYDVKNVECLGSGVINAIQTLASSEMF